MIQHPTVSVIVPARDEAANLTLVLPQVPAQYEIVLVDGHSVDETVAEARAIRPDVVAVQQTRTGKGNALACGLHAASGDIVVLLDADCSADPAEIPRFVRALVEGADFVQGSRFAAGGGSGDLARPQRWVDRGLARAANISFGTAFTDLRHGYRAFWRDLVPVLDLPDVAEPAPPSGRLWGDGFEIDVLLASRFAVAGGRVVEVPSVQRPRAFENSHRPAPGGGLRVLRALLAERERARRLHFGSRGRRLLPPHRPQLAPALTAATR
jgi:glycosyltransferase involved in cell wall biosynthesis